MRRPTHGEGPRFAGRCLLFLLLASLTLTPRLARAQSNPIIIENQQPGTSAWYIQGNTGSDSVGQIKAYTSATSVNKGQSITFYVSVNPAQTYTIDVYRLGWYQGLGGRLMQHISPLNGTQQPTCPTDSTTGMIACNWAPGYTLTHSKPRGRAASISPPSSRIPRITKTTPISWSETIAASLHSFISYLTILTKRTTITHMTREPERVSIHSSSYGSGNRWRDDGGRQESPLMRPYDYDGDLRSMGVFACSGRDAAFIH